jgi:hypothetical protein
MENTATCSCLYLLLLALPVCSSFGPLSNFRPSFSVNSHLNAILNIKFSHIRSDTFSRLYLSPPILLTEIVFHSVILFAVLSLSFLSKCQSHRILRAFMYLTTSACLTSKPVISILIVQLPFDCLQTVYLPCYCSKYSCC